MRKSKKPPAACGTGPDAPDADVDAVVRFGATQDRMKLCVSCYVPARGFGTPLSVDLVRKLLAEAGLDSGLDPKGLALAVHLLQNGQDASHVVIARGARPRRARDAWVEPQGDLAFPVFPGQVIGRLRPAQRAAPGRDFTGLTLPPPAGDPPRDMSRPRDESCTLDQNNLLRAQICGLARVEEGRVWVEPLFLVTDDRLAVIADIYPRDVLGKAIGARRILDELARMGVSEGIRAGQVMAALEQARTGNRCVEGVTVALGQPPEHGRDGWLEFFQGERESVGTMDASGRVDWRERGYSPVVAAGRDIARLHPPTAGTPGRNVFGGEIPARPGSPLPVWPGPHVEALEDGSLFRSRMTGVVLYSRNILEVSELLAVSGDVDYATGNIRVEQGSVLIKGTVRSGFEIQAPRSVFVDEVVEHCRIRAGGDVVVNGGIFMSGEKDAFIRAGGSVSATYTHNARILAGGDVTIAHYITCRVVQSGYRVRSGGRVRVTDPKGRIMGGTVVCAEGLEVFEVGSPLGVATVLALSPESPELRALILEKRQIKTLVAEVDKSLGQGPPEDILARLPAEQRAEALVRLDERDVARKRLSNVLRAFAEVAQAALAGMCGAGIRVSEVAHPGVVITMGGRSLIVERPLGRVRFLWGEERREIYMAGL